jgi:hypothetical protein
VVVSFIGGGNGSGRRKPPTWYLYTGITIKSIHFQRWIHVPEHWRGYPNWTILEIGNTGYTRRRQITYVICGYRRALVLFTLFVFVEELMPCLRYLCLLIVQLLLFVSFVCLRLVYPVFPDILVTYSKDFYGDDF